MTNSTFHKRRLEVDLNLEVRGGNLWSLLDKFSADTDGAKLWFCDVIYGCNDASVAFYDRLPEFRKWMKKHNLTWFKTWEQREAWYDTVYQLDTPELNSYIGTIS